MKKLFLTFICLSMFSFYIRFVNDNKTYLDGFLKTFASHTAKDIYKTKQKKNKNSKITYYLFVPYWSKFTKTFPLVETKTPVLYRYIYFGIKPKDASIDKYEKGYEKLSAFASFFKEYPRSLVLRLTDSQQNMEILFDEKKQNTILEETLSIAKAHGFTEIIIDCEVGTLPDEKTKEAITGFTKKASEIFSKKNVKTAFALYGDVYFRSRPYDVKKIGTFADRVYMMLYDLHKPLGEPGPNFPLFSNSSYYSIEKLIQQLEKDVDRSKIACIFGLYGYDWKVDGKNRTIKKAIAITTAQARSFIENKCKKNFCSVTRDPLARELVVKYKDENDFAHILWFEDFSSIKDKISYLLTKGIVYFAFWASGYY